MDRRLAAYEPVETDPAAVLELERIIKSGFIEQTELPFIPPAPAGGAVPVEVAPGDAPRARRANPRRGR